MSAALLGALGPIALIILLGVLWEFVNRKRTRNRPDMQVPGFRWRHRLPKPHRWDDEP